jgi:hypothetical protein
MSERKRLLKRASRVSPEQIAKVLANEEGNPSRGFLLGDDPENYFVCSWDVSSGPMISMIDDDALHVACVRHLLATGAPVFRSDEEVRAHAAAHGWPGPRSGG